jgi:hypothetical protein
MAVISTSYYANTVQALVNLGRIKLANEIGLEIPRSIDHERRMWWLLTSFVYKNDPEAIKELDRYRKCPPIATTAATEAADHGGAPREDEEGEEPDEAE